MAIDHTDPNYIDMAITKAHLAAGDWALNEFHHSNPFNSYYFYLRDFETDLSIMFSISQEDFYRPLPKSFSLTEVTDGLGYLLRRYIDNGKFQDHEQQCFGVALAVYAKHTQAYKQWLKTATKDSKLHMVISRYPLKSPEAMLRPFIVNPPTTILPGRDFTKLTGDVFDMHMQRHPEWFEISKLYDQSGQAFKSS